MTKGFIVLLVIGIQNVQSFVPTHYHHAIKNSNNNNNNNNNIPLYSTSESSSWSVADDWSTLSESDSTVDSNIVFDADYAKKVADEMAAAYGKPEPLSEEDVWIRDVVDEIHNAFSTLDSNVPLYDTSYEEPSIKDTVNNDMDDEIAMLIRCNEQPETMLIAGREGLTTLDTGRER